MLSDTLAPIIARYDEITTKLASPEITSDIRQLTALSREQSSIQEIAHNAKEYFTIRESIKDNKSLLEDKELGELAKEELKILESKKQALEECIKVLLIPKDPNDEKNIYLELRAGTGGDEAGIFVGDLFKAYCRYADLKGWKVEIISSNENDVGGYKEIIALIKGGGAFSKLNTSSAACPTNRITRQNTHISYHSGNYARS